MPTPRRRQPAPSAQTTPSADVPQSESLLLLVTGSTIASEMRDRPIAYRLRERVLGWLDAARNGNGEAPVLQPVVCSDLWYLNARELDDRPAIAIGEPSSNAATALISSRLPTAFVIEGSLRVHLDPEFIDLRAALWGVTAASTAAAIDLFAERYLDAFLNAV
ncbi:MAG TPA: hypothetical protein VMS30_08950 [Phycisphaerales bacterium]|nr:hypothetical protein [Phycisphaerales bacterium]